MGENEISLKNSDDEIRSTAKAIFANLMGLPLSIRPDEAKHCGIQVYIREMHVGGMMFFSVGNPCEADMVLAIEQALTAFGNMETTSQKSDNPKELIHAGSICVDMLDCFIDERPDRKLIQVSVAGLLPEENAAIAILILAKLKKCRPMGMCNRVREQGGFLPECFQNDNHYLSEKTMMVLY